MGKRQTRRSISIKGLTYQRLKDYCDKEGRSVSGVIEDIVAERLDAAGVPVPDVLRPRSYPVKRKREKPEDAAGGIFTF